jgi:hypothetical protein
MNAGAEKYSQLIKSKAKSFGFRVVAFPKLIFWKRMHP